MRFITCCLCLVVFCFAQVAMGGAYDTRACIERNKKFGGAFAKCAEDICNYDNCIERNTTTKKYGIDVKNPGSGEQALNPCEPYRQIMERCQRANLTKKAKPKPKPWCHTGDQANYDYIKSRHGQMLASLNDLKTHRATFRERFKKHKEAWEVVLTTVRPQAKAHHQDLNAVKASKDKKRIERYKNTWVRNGRWKKLKDFYRAGKEQKQLAKEALEEIKSANKQIAEIDKKLRPVGMAMNNHDCATAYRLLQSY
jgi:hypothetical protein